MDNRNNNNNGGFDGRQRGYARQQQAAMYGYPPLPAGTTYPMANMTAPSTPGTGYNMLPQYSMNLPQGNPQMHTYMASPGMGQVIQQPQYPIPQARYPPQTPSYQPQQQAPQVLSQVLLQQQQQSQQRQPQQFMHPQSVHAYRMDGAGGYPSSMHQPQGTPNQYAPSRQQQTPSHAMPRSNSNARPIISTPSGPQSQPRPQPQQDHARRLSQSHPQAMPSPIQTHTRNPSQLYPQTRPTPQMQTHPMSPPQPQSHPRQLSQSQAQSGSQQRPLSQTRTPQVVIESRRASSQNQTTPVQSQMPAPVSKDGPLDYQLLLLGMADQYISKAHGMSTYLARNPQEADVDQYFGLISAGLGCIESVLKNWKFPDPKVEARLQLQYANLLLEETDNDAELQDLLTKGVTLCQRNRLHDLEYSMKHVQARSLFRTHPRSAFKMVDQNIEITEALSHWSWMYVFRFLRVSFSFQLQKPDPATAVQQLRRIYQLAERQRQYPILAICSVMEALAHLRMGQTDSAEQFQRCLAAARTHQLNPDVAGISQITALLDCLDLCSDLMNGKSEQLNDKMNVMQKALDGGKRKTASDGSFSVPTTDAAPLDISLDTGGIMERSVAGKRAITFQWLRKSELYAVGYIFSSLASLSKNLVDRKAEKYVIEGGKLTQDDYNPENERKVQSLECSSAHMDRRLFYHRVCLHLLTSARCERSDWVGAQEALEVLAENFQGQAIDEEDFIQVSMLYLTGIIKQATGDLETALQCYRHPALTLQPGEKATLANQDLRILSTLNTILMLRPRPECRAEVDRLLEMVEPLCSTHPNTSFLSAFHIVRASSTNNLPILKMKNFLSTSANIAKRQNNSLMLCMTINLMTSAFFVDIMGEKAEMSAGAGRKLAERTKNPLWQAVSNQMLSNTLNFGGKRAEAGEAEAEAQKWMQLVPEGVQERFERQR